MLSKNTLGVPRHFLDLHRLSSADLRRIIDHTIASKKNPHPDHKPLLGKTLAMIFEKPSTRTRISFEVGMKQLGGETVVLRGEEMQLHRDETLSDTAKILSRYVDCVMMRTSDEQYLQELADSADIPIINGLTDQSHPCQIVADIVTYEESRGNIKGKTVAWSGDANNVCASWIHAAVLLGFKMNIATPKEFAPSLQVMRWLEEVKGRESITLFSDAHAAVKGADLVVTDTWVSMGNLDVARRKTLLAPFQVTESLMQSALPTALFMHCLPAHRGEEVTSEVADGKQSVIWDEAENRLHAQKSILQWCLRAGL
ncbi:MAG: ornithine carbamoyltransferase [Candidatus Pacebacteria bacterium]|nr:ornithine carbamoyltransferase [Candidatus Paceibacterota bacterium]